MKKLLFLLVSLPVMALAQNTITANHDGISTLGSAAFSQKLIPGWNLGNTLEATDTWTTPGVAIPCETCWSNPMATQLLIDSVKAAGFHSVRIPVAWSLFSNSSTYTIDAAWMARVTEVVNYVLNSGMYAVVNIHYDGGWMEPTYAKQAYVNKRLGAMWRQIAINFRDYNDHLLFAGTNEVMVKGDYGTPTYEYYTVQNSFNQTFVDTVRATGGRNSYRYLLVQGFNTNIDHAYNYMVIPTDKVPSDETSKRLMIETHYYDPYNFTADEKNTTITQWGANATNASLTAGWADEDWADAEMSKMKSKFYDAGYGVVMGEYGAVYRTLSGYAAYRLDWMEYVTEAMVKRGIVPMYWDNGPITNNAFGLFNRNTGEEVYTEIIDAIMNKTSAYTVPLEGSTGFQKSNVEQSPRVSFQNGLLTLESQNGTGRVLFANMQGQVVHSFEMKAGVNSYDASRLSAGLYVVRISTAGGIISKVLLKE